jgi:hypothetical protein
MPEPPDIDGINQVSNRPYIIIEADYSCKSLLKTACPAIYSLNGRLLSTNASFPQQLGSFGICIVESQLTANPKACPCERSGH